MVGLSKVTSGEKDFAHKHTPTCRDTYVRAKFKVLTIIDYIKKQRTGPTWLLPNPGSPTTSTCGSQRVAISLFVLVPPNSPRISPALVPLCVSIHMTSKTQKDDEKTAIADVRHKGCASTIFFRATGHGKFPTNQAARTLDSTANTKGSNRTERGSGGCGNGGWGERAGKKCRCASPHDREGGPGYLDHFLDRNAISHRR